MEYQFCTQLMVRSPLYSFKKYHTHDVKDFLKDPFFKFALYLASRSFYYELEKLNFEAALLSEGQKKTLTKYLNRASFRSTPFGFFSAFALGYWEKDNQAVNSTFHDLQAHMSFDFALALRLGEAVMEEDNNCLIRYRTNSSVYKVYKSFRYIRYLKDGCHNYRQFFIASVDCHPLLESLLQHCTEERSIREIAAYLADHDVEVKESQQFLQHLVEAQLLLSSFEANIIGEDFLDRQLKQVHASGDKAALIRGLQQLLGQFSLRDLAETPLIKSESVLQQIVEKELIPKDLFYAALERRMPVRISKDYQKQITEGLYCLNRLIPFQRIASLDNFKAAFSKRFESRMIPLLMAMDPEVGIGYESLERTYNGATEEDGFFNEEERTPGNYLLWTEAHALLLKKWHTLMMTGNTRELHLEEDDIRQLSLPENYFALPPTMSVMFRVFNDQLYLEHAGGCSATSLIGRFTSFSPCVHKLAQQIARLEQQSYTDCIVAEVAHICNEHSANINRRQQIYEYEIPVLVNSTLEKEHQLLLSDLYVGVVDDEIRLWSKKLQKRIIPRMSSAFNYKHNDLSVFRFLCDLQYQGLKTHFKLNLADYFPGLSFYPRVSYKKTILQLASWHLKLQPEHACSEKGAPERLAAFEAWLKSHQLPRYVSYGRHDQQLVADLENKTDVQLLLGSFKKEHLLVLTEFPDVQAEPYFFEDEMGKPLLAQFVACIYQNWPTGPGETHFQVDENHKVKRNYLPGSRWLYFKIYCHPVSGNDILTTYLIAALKKIFKEKRLKSWFFIRYKDPDFHLRLRMMISSASLHEIVRCFHDKLDLLLKEGLIVNFQIDTYNREIERYSPVWLPYIEQCFWRSSELVAAYIQKKSGPQVDSEVYGLDLIIVSLDAMLTCFGFSLDHTVNLYDALFRSFYKRFGERKTIKASVEKKYTCCKAHIEQVYNQRACHFSRSLNRLIHTCDQSYLVLQKKLNGATWERKKKLVADLIHMHLNRIFTEEANKHELIVYYLLYRHYNALKYKARLVV